MSKIFFHLFINITMLIAGIVNVHAQTSLSASVAEIMKSNANSERKLAQLYSLKKNAENTFHTNDSGYTVVLLDIANYEGDKNYQLALSLCLKATASIKQYQASHSLKLRCYYNTATFFYYLSQFDKAFLYFDTVVELSSVNDPSDYLLNAIYYRAFIDNQLGDYERMLNDCSTGIERAIAGKDTSFQNLFLYLSAFGLVMQEQTNAASAPANECIRLSILKRDTLQLVDAYSIKANIYTNQKQYLLAEQLYKKVLQYRANLPPDYSSLAIDYNDIGNFYLKESNDYRKANDCFQNAVRYSSMCRADVRSRRLFISFCNAGDVYAMWKRPFEAFEYYSKALASVNVVVKDFTNSNPELKKLNLITNKDALLSILTSKCNLLLNLYRTSGKTLYIRNCIQTSLLADSLITQMRHEQLGEKSKLYWRNKTRGLFSVALEACYISGNTDSAFYFMEKSRSVLLTDKLNELTSNASYLSKKDADKETDLQRRIITLESELETVSPSSSQYARIETPLSQAREDLEKHIKFIEKNNPRYFQYKYADDIPSATQLKNYLTKIDQSFIYYFVNDSAIYALGFSKDKSKFIKILPSDLNSRQLSEFSRLCSNKQAINSHYNLFSTLAQTICTKIFQPLQIPAGKVAICNDNFFIPFEALCTDDKGKHFLLNDYSFSYVYSARSILKPFICDSKPEGDFAGFAPVSFSPALHVFSLTKSSEALQNTSQYYGNPILFTKQDATRHNFLSQASKYAVVTVFSHARADTTDKEPVLYMQDSLIRLSELQTLSNSAIRFVLLSACQTNTGKNATGEGIYSLARGFAAAGIPSVSATLWNADEEAVYKISAKFNECLSKGMNKSDALRQAKLDYLQNGDREHALPYYWANVVLIGTDDPVSFTKPDHNWIWLAVLTLVFLLLIIFIIWKHKHRIIEKNTIMNV